MPAKRVLIFDSGVGGLSVYQQIIKLTPSIKCHYLFDNAYFPYGELPHLQLIKRLIQLLSEFMSQHPADLLVIACNSASTVALEALRKHFSIPIVGVVPAIKPATLITQNNVIGLLATPGTIERAYTTTLIEQFATGKTVLRIGSTKLVTLAEDKLIGKSINLNDVKAVVSPWLKNEHNMPDTIVLGCTHFPLIKDEIEACFDRPIYFVDSGAAIAVRVKQLLTLDHKALKLSPCNKTKQEHQAFYTKNFTNTEHLSTLKCSFAEYSFQRMTFCDL
ncbi:glutamate racemase [Psychromonas sp. RZ22]|uniref:glutamate racemase n=1 Tax=Psychromonas algarum TaxID=2555643 RepID=UPI00106835EF|nr:glutamate racemase [Psychromonas sp. RZ22]TEW53747.1 glutamate racemase [Psychromonas sp. RZ22]